MKRSARHVKLSCFYCPELCHGPQGRAAHIRGAHPGLPYHPTEAQIAKYSMMPDPEPVVAAVPPPMPEEAVPQLSIVALTPRQHLVAAISELKQQLERTNTEIPALEKQLQDLRASQVRVGQDLQAFETALGTIDGTNQSKLELITEPAPPTSESIQAPPAPTPARNPRPATARHAMGLRSRAATATSGAM